LKALQLLFNNFDLLLDQPDGVKQMKQAILQWAVQGKLVRQDPNDEPASELLKRAVSEMEKFRQAKRTRIVRELPGFDKSDPLPSMWVWAPLQQLVQFIDYRGKTPKKTNTGIRLLTAKNIKRGFISLAPEEFVTRDTYDSWMTRGFPQCGDVLFTTEAPMGHATLVNLEERFALAQRTINFHPYGDYLGAFLVIVLLSPWFSVELNKRATGMTAKGIKAEKLRLIRIPVPPSAEQHRIVAKVDELHTLCDQLEEEQQQVQTRKQALNAASLHQLSNAEDSKDFQSAWNIISSRFEQLHDQPKSVEPVRQAILQLAMQGKLVKQDPNDEPASELLKRIAEETWKIPERPRRAKLHPSIENLAGIKKLPVGWQEVRLEEVTQLINGRAYKKPELLLEGNTPIIRIQNLNGGSNWFFSNLELPKKQYCNNGDLLFAWSASFGPYIWTGAKAIYHYHIWKLILPNAIEKKFLYYSLMSLTRSVKSQSHGLTMLHMTKVKMERWPLLLPPRVEQHRIVAKVDELMALCDQLEQQLTQSRADGQRLLQSILAEVSL